MAWRITKNPLCLSLAAWLVLTYYSSWSPAARHARHAALLTPPAMRMDSSEGSLLHNHTTACTTKAEVHLVGTCWNCIPLPPPQSVTTLAGTSTWSFTGSWLEFLTPTGEAASTVRVVKQESWYHCSIKFALERPYRTTHTRTPLRTTTHFAQGCCTKRRNIVGRAC